MPEPMGLEHETLKDSLATIHFLEIPQPEVFSSEALKAIVDLDCYFKAMAVTANLASEFLNKHFSETNVEQISRFMPSVYQEFSLLKDLRTETDKLYRVVSPLGEEQSDSTEEKKARDKINHWYQELSPNFTSQQPILTITDQEALELILLKMGLTVDHDLKNKVTVVIPQIQMINRAILRGKTTSLIEQTQNLEDGCRELQNYISQDVVKFLSEKVARDEDSPSINLLRDQMSRRLKVNDFTMDLDVAVKVGEIPSELKDLKIDLPRFLLDSVIINLASNAGKAALLRQDAQKANLMEPDKKPLPHVEPEVSVEFLPTSQTEYPIPADKMAMLDQSKKYILVITKDNFIGYPTHFIAHGFTGISKFEESHLPTVTGKGVGMVGMERFIKPYGGAFILQNRTDTLGAITIWAVPLLS